MVRFASSRRGRVVGGLIAALSAVLFSSLAIADAEAEAKITLAAREVVIPAPGSKQAANPDPLALAPAPLCPKTPYGKWYPFSRRTMPIFGIMEIKKDRIRFGKLGEFRFKIHRGPRNVPYLELLDVPVAYGYPVIEHYIVLNYDHEGIAFESCLIWVNTCRTAEYARDIIGNAWLPKEKQKDNYCNGDTYIPYKNRRE
ncbi:hypothetical protein [Varunaivibrio sulfuroxidans]|uniref:Uncharacterized protein n=1 Tax=Varunaivibrio sulfuroxidans TaxID=1773489 RepID=A0A4R3JDY4_9PROT|nr:hypothetical protein [Varunaivibrio sulfuroxidans]TCS63967.1 hypothetical protein EDD55_1024 [Varunaivibrio sulfuroxidans]WES31579.1 hypothetical protein P3M64_04200 [Varunaivibrio sulfuroxidans]